MTNPTPTRPEPTTPTREELLRPMRRFMDWGDAARVSEEFFDALKQRKWSAPCAIRERELRGQIGTGPSSDDLIRSLWVNDHLVATAQLYRDSRNFTVLVCWEAEPAASVPVPTPEVEEIRKRHEDLCIMYGGEPWDESCVEDGERAHMDRGRLLALLARSQDGRG